MPQKVLSTRDTQAPVLVTGLAATDGATVTFDCAKNSFHTLTIGGNRTFALSGDVDNQNFWIAVTQDGTGGRTISWWSGITWVEGSGLGELDSAASHVTYYAFKRVSSGVYIGWRSRQSGGTYSPGGSDTQVQFNDGGSFGGDSGLVFDKTNNILSGDWLKNTAGDKYVTADVTNATTTFSNLSDLTITLITGRKYTFNLVIFLSDSTSIDGAKLDFNGGTVTATTFRAEVTAYDTALQLATQSTALSTVLSASTFTGAGCFEIEGYIKVNAGGTFIPRFAQNSHTTGTLTAFEGSYLWIKDIG